MNNLLSYFGLVDAKIRASDKDLPVFSPPRSSMVEETTALLSSLDGSCSFLLEALNVKVAKVRESNKIHFGIGWMSSSIISTIVCIFMSNVPRFDLNYELE